MRSNLELNGLSTDIMFERDLLSLGESKTDDRQSKKPLWVVMNRKMHLGEMARFHKRLEIVLNKPVDLELLMYYPELREVFHEIHALLRTVMAETPRKKRGIRTRERKKVIAKGSSKSDPKPTAESILHEQYGGEWVELMRQLDSFAEHRDVTPIE